MGWDNLINEALSVGGGHSQGIKIKVVGVGGGGCNSINRLSKMNLNAELIAVNTDEPHLNSIDAHKKVVIGKSLIRGRGGVGGRMELGEQAAQMAYKHLYKILDGADIIFVLSTLGGGTGGGAGPVIAEIAKQAKSLVVSIVTMPFKSEGKGRWSNAKIALEKFRANSNTVIVLDNNRLLELASKLPLEKAFLVMDTLIADIIKNVSDAISLPSLMNIDYSDLETVMRRGGTSTILYSEGSYYTPEDAVVETLNNPLMDIDYRHASGVLLHITGGPQMTLRTVYRITEGITSGIQEDAEVKVGARIDDRYRNKIKVTAILTGVHTPFVKEVNTGYERVKIGIERYIPMVY